MLSFIDVPYSADDLRYIELKERILDLLRKNSAGVCSGYRFVNFPKKLQDQVEQHLLETGQIICDYLIRDGNEKFLLGYRIPDEDDLFWSQVDKDRWMAENFAELKAQEEANQKNLENRKLLKEYRKWKDQIILQTGREEGIISFERWKELKAKTT